MSDDAKTLRRPELHRLAQPFPPQFVAKKEGADYVNHAIVQQRLLGTLGPFSISIDEVIRGDFDARVTGQGSKRREWPARQNAIVGVVLTCVFEIDGRPVAVSEIGEPEGYYMASHDGERLKKAVSDALKRCAMRVGVGLDLWSKGTYVLPTMLERDTVEVESEADAPDHDGPDPDQAAASEDETGPAFSYEVAKVEKVDDEAAPHADDPQQDELPPPPDDEPDASTTTTPVPITSGQRNHIFALLKSGSVNESQRKRSLKAIYGVDSINDLTADEASKLIDTLKQDGAVNRFVARGQPAEATA